MTLHPDLTNALGAVQHSPDDVAAWQRLALMITAHGTPAQLQQTFGQRQHHAGDGVAILFKALFDADLSTNVDLRNRLILFAEATADDHFGAVLRFFSGSALLCHGDSDKGVEALGRAASFITDNPDTFLDVQHLIKAPAFARMALSKEETDDRILNGSTLDIPPMTLMGDIQPDPSGRWVFASCDSRYFETFSDRFCAVAGTLGPIHVHVVNPTDEQQKWMTANTAPKRQFSVEHQTLYQTSPYYASNRFFHLPAIMARYESEILMLDVDLAKLTDIDVAIAAMAEADIGYFAMPTIMPWLRHHAAFIRYSRKPETRRFAERFSRLLQSAFTGSTWFVDQMSFLNFVNLQRSSGGDIKIAGLEAADGYPFSRFVLPAGEDDTKALLRMQAGLSA